MPVLAPDSWGCRPASYSSRAILDRTELWSLFLYLPKSRTVIPTLWGYYKDYKRTINVVDNRVTNS